MKKKRKKKNAYLIYFLKTIPTLIVCVMLSFLAPSCGPFCLESFFQLLTVMFIFFIIIECYYLYQLIRKEIPKYPISKIIVSNLMSFMIILLSCIIKPNFLKCFFDGTLLLYFYLTVIISFLFIYPLYVLMIKKDLKAKKGKRKILFFIILTSIGMLWVIYRTVFYYQSFQLIQKKDISDINQNCIHSYVVDEEGNIQVENKEDCFEGFQLVNPKNNINQFYVAYTVVSYNKQYLYYQVHHDGDYAYVKELHVIDIHSGKDTIVETFKTTEFFAGFDDFSMNEKGNLFYSIEMFDAGDIHTYFYYDPVKNIKTKEKLNQKYLVFYLTEDDFLVYEDLDDQYYQYHIKTNRTKHIKKTVFDDYAKKENSY